MHVYFIWRFRSTRPFLFLLNPLQLYTCNVVVIVISRMTTCSRSKHLIMQQRYIVEQRK